jgi:hypothetical protein
VDGNWDLSEKDFQGLDVYAAIRDVLVLKQARWEETEWYQSSLERILAGQRLWGCRDAGEWRRRMITLEGLYRDIAAEGYRSQAELAQAGSDWVTGDEVSVAVGRSGELLFGDGAHRLAIALLQGVARMPVRVAVRHPDWASFRSALSSLAASSGGQLYQPALHPDLSGIASAHGCEDRWSLFSRVVPSAGGKALDLGANLGYFCHCLEQRGWACTAVENDPEVVYFTRGIRNACGRTFSVVSQSMYSGVLDCEEFDLVLALNILHHSLKTKQEFRSLERFLSELRCSDLILEPHGEQEPQMAGAYAALSPSEFVDFVSARTGLARCSCLGEVADGRMLWHLSG